MTKLTFAWVAVLAATACETTSTKPTLDGGDLAPPGRQQSLDVAQAAYAANPHDLEATIWLGRRLAYLGRYREAIDTYSSGLELHPGNPKLLRHRGHRYLTVRDFEAAVRDLEQAADRLEATPDEIEPDGIPNSRNQPTGTLHFNVWYHLGLAHYLRHDFEPALAAYRQCLDVSTNPDTLCATAHWLHMTMRRAGGFEVENRALLKAIHPGLDVIENRAYLDCLLLYRGEKAVNDVLNTDRGNGPGASAAATYGVANWLHDQSDPRGVAMLRELAQSPGRSAFGVLAAEADLDLMDKPR